MGFFEDMVAPAEVVAESCQIADAASIQFPSALNTVWRVGYFRFDLRVAWRGALCSSPMDPLPTAPWRCAMSFGSAKSFPSAFERNGTGLPCASRATALAFLGLVVFFGAAMVHSELRRRKLLNREVVICQ